MHLQTSAARRLNLVLACLGAAALVPAVTPMAQAESRPVASPGFTVSTFAVPPAGLSKPDSLALIEGSVWIGYGNGGKPDGSNGAMSQIVQYSLDGKVQKTLTIKGHNDGLKLDPVTKKVWALQNEDGDADIVVVDPQTGAMESYVFGPGKHGGGYDDVVFKNGQAFVTASAPSVDGGKTNPGPSVVTATLVAADHTVKVEPAFAGAPTVTDIVTGKTETVNLTDPDSITEAPSGDLVMTSQDDGEILLIRETSVAGGTGGVLHLLGGVKIDDTTFTTAQQGFLLVADTAANMVYKIEAANWGRGKAFSAMSGVEATKTDPAIAGYVGLMDMSSGALVPIVADMQAPHGMIFVEAR